MRDSFFGFNLALRGLYTAQRNLDIVNHNLNNINTPGYSRQSSVQTAATPMAVYDGTGMMGTGANISGVKRTRDEFLDTKFWGENSNYGEWETKKNVADELQAILNEPSESGFTTVTNDFYNSIQELSKDPSSKAVRALVRQKAITFTKYFNSMASHLEKVQDDINNRVKSKVEEVNTYASQIVSLNSQIFQEELQGSVANDLRDQRTNLIDKLSKVINIDATEVESGYNANGDVRKRLVISISGKALVDDHILTPLELKQRNNNNRLNEEDVDFLYDIKWSDGNSIDIRSGELKGYLDLRDGSDGLNGSPNYLGIPHYIKKLDEFVRTFSKAFNEGIIDQNEGTGHVHGYTGDSDFESEASNIRFFSFVGQDGKIAESTFYDDYEEKDDAYKFMTAKNFSIGSEVDQDPMKICTSEAGGEKGNTLILQEFLEMRKNNKMFNEGQPEDFMKATIATLGIDSQQAVRYFDNQNSILQQVSKRRESDSGVSIDEEMTNLVKFQHAYSANAKMITTLMEIYNILINQTGL